MTTTLEEHYAELIASRLRRSAPRGTSFHVRPALLQAGKVEVRLTRSHDYTTLDAAEFIREFNSPHVEWERIVAAVETVEDAHTIRQAFRCFAPAGEPWDAVARMSCPGVVRVTVTVPGGESLSVEVKSSEFVNWLMRVGLTWERIVRALQKKASTQTETP